MRKKISKQKHIQPIKRLYDQKNEQNKQPSDHIFLPLLSLKLLKIKSECSLHNQKFKANKINLILKSKYSKIKLIYEQLKKFNQVQYVKKYYDFNETIAVFTDLIKKNCLQKQLVFMDFKLQNYLIMNQYASSYKRLKEKQLPVDTKAHSQKSIKQIQDINLLDKRKISAIKITSKQHTTNDSKLFIEHLTNKIDLMLNQQVQNQQKNNNYKCNINRRLHTTPQKMDYSDYGYPFISKKQKKIKIQNIIRCETEYQNNYWIQSKKVKTKKSSSKSKSRDKKIIKKSINGKM